MPDLAMQPSPGLDARVRRVFASQPPRPYGPIVRLVLYLLVTGARVVEDVYEGARVSLRNSMRWHRRVMPGDRRRSIIAYTALAWLEAESQFLRP
jgi:hypothetical protein